MLKLELAVLAGVLFCGAVEAQTYEPVADWLQLPAGRATLGPMHGDIAVSKAGEVYVSVETPRHGRAGLLARRPLSQESRQGAGRSARLRDPRRRRRRAHLWCEPARPEVRQDDARGRWVLEIPREAIPREYWTENRFSTELGVLLSGMDVAPNGDLYVTDGYSSDYVHRFDPRGRYRGTFGGKGAPYEFNILHKIAMDTRFDPVRIIATDRLNNRVVHLSLAGEFLGVVNDDLLLPAALTIDGDNVIVAELNGRITILDKAGKAVMHVGTNTAEGIGSNRVPPEQWRTGYVVAPHGVATNAEGDVFIAEFSTFGRVHKFDRR